MQNWLLFLGAGASRPGPTHLPPFEPLAQGLLKAIDWAPVDDGSKRWRHIGQPQYPEIANVTDTPEVLLGTLHAFGVPFTNEVVRVLSKGTPNAVHEVAATVLQQGGCVWTTNIDRAVEDACEQQGLSLHRTGPARPPSKRTWLDRLLRRKAEPDSTIALSALDTTAGGTYVKFHGTLDDPETISFTDRQLIAPLQEGDFDHLALLARNRVVVFYGYLGADADLADLVERIIDDAREVYWFEPSAWSYNLIRQAYPQAKSRVTFAPDWADPDAPHTSGAMATAFFNLAARSGHQVSPSLQRALAQTDDIAPPHFTITGVSGAMQARLVERFGASSPDDEKEAWRLARSQDRRAHRYHLMARYVSHAITYGLYHGGRTEHVVRWFAAHRTLLQFVRPSRVRSYLITRAGAVLLREGDADELRSYADWAIALRSGSGTSNPSDAYYGAQAYRYALHPSKARQLADTAIRGLESISDPERLAGALYEAGEAAIYQADFAAALDYAFQLRFRRGRYAIPRWQAWGAWLQVVALAHTGDIDEADYEDTPSKRLPPSPLRAMNSRFDFEDLPLNRADARTAELLLARVRLEKAGELGLETLDHYTDQCRERRYLDDLDLLRADIAIAQVDYAQAELRLRRVLRKTKVPIANHCARRGLAELDRLADPDHCGRAADEFAALAAEARHVGALWFEAQAAVGLEACRDPRSDAMWRSLVRRWPQQGGLPINEVRSQAMKPRRTLWLVTI